MNGQLVYVLIAGLIIVLNGLALFWLKDVKSDVRELRQGYFNALKEVSDLKVVIAELNSEIVILKSRIK